jgi:hypothetical protein
MKRSLSFTSCAQHDTTHFPSRRITCNFTGTFVLGRTGLTSVGKGGLAIAAVFALVGVEATDSAFSLLAAALAALLRRGVETLSCLAEVVDTLETTEEDRPRLGVDLREPGMLVGLLCFPRASCEGVNLSSAMGDKKKE